MDFYFCLFLNRTVVYHSGGRVRKNLCFFVTMNKRASFLVLADAVK